MGDRLCPWATVASVGALIQGGDMGLLLGLRTINCLPHMPHSRGSSLVLCE